MRCRVVETDNFGWDCPNEKFVDVPPMDEEDAKIVADLANKAAGPGAFRFWKVVEVGYKLAGGFKP